MALRSTGRSGRRRYSLSGHETARQRRRFPQLVEPPVDLPPAAPRALRDLVEAALAFDPAARPAAAELALGLEPLVAALPRRMVLGRRGIMNR